MASKDGQENIPFSQNNQNNKHLNLLLGPVTIMKEKLGREKD